ncbi:MAG: MFS transporter [Dehalococcoidia bacterium]
MTAPTVPLPTGPAPARGMRAVYFGYWILGAAFVAQFVSVGAQNYVFGAFFTPMTDDLGWSRSEMTLSRTIGQFIAAFAGFYIGGYVDRYGGRWLMRIGVVILATALFLCSFVQELWQWWLINGLILTVGAALIGNLVVNVTLAKWFVLRRGRVVGFAAMGVSFAGVVLTPLATLLVDELGWRAAWQVLAAGALLFIVPTSFVMRRAPEDHGLQPDGLSAAQMAAGAGDRAAADFASSLTRAQALRTRAFYLVVFAFGLGGLSIGVMLIQTIPFLTDAGYSRTFAALMITVTSVPSLLSKPVWGYFIDRADAQRLSIVGFVLTAAAIVVIVVGAKSSGAVVFAGYALLGLGWGGFIPLQEVVWASYFGRRYLGAVRSAGLPFSLLLGASAPLLASVYFDRVGNYDGAFLAVAAAGLLAVVLILAVPRTTRGRVEA